MTRLEPTARARTVGLAVLAGLVFAACESTLQNAVERVRAVRPQARLERISVTSWSQLPPSRVEDGAMLSFPFVRSVIAAQTPLLVQIGVITPDEQAPLAARMAGDDAGWVAAFVVPAQALIVVRPESAHDLQLMTHELGHLASHELGYQRLSELGLGLRADKPRDPAWIDLDAFLSSWAIEEGIAEVTARAAESFAASRTTDLAELAVGLDYAKRITERTTLAGPGTIVLGERRFDLKAGEQVVVQPTLEELLIEFAYAGGQGYVLAHVPVAPLEAHFAAVWRDCRHTTREILRPRDGPEHSRLASALGEQRTMLAPEPVSATRVGAFFAFHVATARGEDPTAALQLACALRDDLALRFLDGSALWIARFENEASAAEFAQRLRSRTSAVVDVSGKELRVIAGNVPASLVQRVAGW